MYISCEFFFLFLSLSFLFILSPSLPPFLSLFPFLLFLLQNQIFGQNLKIVNETEMGLKELDKLKLKG